MQFTKLCIYQFCSLPVLQVNNFIPNRFINNSKTKMTVGDNFQGLNAACFQIYPGCAANMHKFVQQLSTKLHYAPLMHQNRFYQLCNLPIMQICNNAATAYQFCTCIIQQFFTILFQNNSFSNFCRFQNRRSV